MTDPIRQVREQLVQAARRDAAAAAARRGRRRRLLPLLAVGGALIAGTATAAVLTSGEPSAPLAGPVPGKSASGYRLDIQPDLRTGTVGWCSTVRLTNDGRDTGYGQGCGPAATQGSAQIAAGSTVIANRQHLQFVITPARVPFARRRDGSLIRTETGATLPFGWRAAIVIDRLAPGKLDSYFENRLRPADSDGQVVAAEKEFLFRPSPSAGERCQVTGGPAGSTASTGRRPARPIAFEGRPFRVCWLAKYSRGARAAFLVDAQQPDRPAADLPGARPVSGGRVVATGGLLARRAGHGWLVVQARPSARRSAILKELRVVP